MRLMATVVTVGMVAVMDGTRIVWGRYSKTDIFQRFTFRPKVKNVEMGRATVQSNDLKQGLGLALDLGIRLWL